MSIWGALSQYITPTSTVLRDSNATIIKSEFLVLGDIIILQAGEKVPADCKIVETDYLKLDESIVTERGDVETWRGGDIKEKLVQELQEYIQKLKDINGL